jgi:hypothetical protein
VKASAAGSTKHERPGSRDNRVAARGSGSRVIGVFEQRIAPEYDKNGQPHTVKYGLKGNGTVDI